MLSRREKRDARRALRRLGPSDEVMSRVDAAVRAQVRAMAGGDPAAAGAAPGGAGAAFAVRRRRRRLITAITVGALVVGSAAAGAALWVSHGAGEPIAGVTPEGRAGLRESPTLSSAAWVFQDQGAPHIRDVRRLPAIQFPPRTTYAQAVNALLRSVMESGTVPKSARVVAKLPPGVVWRTGDAKRGPRLDLTAPWGYTLPRGLVRTPTLRVDPSLSGAQASKLVEAFMKGAKVGRGRADGITADVPKLFRCQVQAIGRAPRVCPPVRPRATS